MATNRLQPENLTDFTGGLNYSTDQFSLADNESPDMMNIDLDPRSGFSTRRGWRRWNDADIAPVLPWQPRNAVVHTAAAGDQTVFVVNNQKIYAAPESGVFTELVGPQAVANPQGADFASWGEVAYIACGMDQSSYRYNANGTLTVMSYDVWSEVDAPVANTMPSAGLCEAHAGYLFTARLAEAGFHYNTRIRWSHPNRPDSWRESDYLDIDAYGGKVTAIMSFRDHLLIFKTTSMWALYGYGDESWQLTLVSSSIGCPAITATTKSENSVFFFSASNKNGIYAYAGGEPTYISDNLRPALSQINSFPNVFVSWANRKLWVAVPWRPDSDPPESTTPPPPPPPIVGTTGEQPLPTAAMPEPASLFLFDPDIGQGVWTIYRSPYGSVSSVVDGSDINSKFPLAAFWSQTTATMLVLDAIDDAYDEIYKVDGDLVRSGFAAYYRTRWLHGGWPDRKKSWRRPTFICRRVPRQVDLLVEHFRDYDETTTRRTGLVPGVVGEGDIWSAGGSADDNGIDWGEADARWGAQVQGAVIVRSDPMGHARAMQLRVLPASYTQLRKWGVDGIIIKTTVQRFRT